MNPVTTRPEHRPACAGSRGRPTVGPSRRSIRAAGRAAAGAWTLLLTASLLTIGCGATILKPTEADESRREVQRLEREVERLELRIAGLEREIALERRLASGESDLPSLATLLPIPVQLEFGRFSGPVRAADGTATLARFYLRPIDGRGRFVHPLGDLAVEILAWPTDGEPVRRLELLLGPDRLAEAYRSGPTGTHYTIEVPLDPPLAPTDSLVVRGTLGDAVTGGATVVERVFGPDRRR